MKNRTTMGKVRGLLEQVFLRPAQTALKEGAERRESRTHICAITAIVVFLFVHCTGSRLYAQAQASNASLGGAVYDHTGAVVPGATVTLSNAGTALSRTFTTGGDGHYSFSLVPAGTYTLQVEASGFRTFVQSGLVLAVGQAATQDVTLQLGTVSEQVTVTSSVPLLNTTNANVSSDVDQRQTTELPLNWRNVFGLVSLNSSVNNSQQNQALNPAGSQGTADQDIAFFNFGGGRFGTTAFLLDGHWDGAGDWDGIVYVPSVDETQEFKIQTNTFTAQYGWSMGNVVNAVTKSGTNSLHGDAFEFLRNSDLDANYFFNNSAGVPRPQFKRNQFGGTVGGPLYIPKLYEQRNKTFFFGDYEGLRQQTPLTLVATVPTSDFKSGNFSALLGPQTGTDCLGRPVLTGEIYNPFTTRKITAGQVDAASGVKATCSGFIRDPIAGNMIPSAIMDSVAKNLLQYWPSPTSSAISNNYTASGGAPVESNAWTVRIDQNISDKSRLFGRFSWKHEFKQLSGELFGANDPGGPGTVAPDNRWDAAFDYTRIFGPTLVMSLNIGWNRWTEGRLPQGVPFNPSTVGLPSFLDTNPGAFPFIGIDGYNLSSTGYALGSGGLNSTPREARSVSLDFTKVRGPHTLNVGFTFIDFYLTTFNSTQGLFTFPRNMTQGPDPTTATPTTGWGFASFLLGTGNNVANGATINANGAFTKLFYGWYVQDDWKATRKLTLNLGLRYDIQTAPTDRFNRYSWFNFTGPNPISNAVGFTVPGYLIFTGPPNRRGIYDPQYTNFAPRVGLSYQVTPRLVARAGFGMFYTPAIEFGDYQGLSLSGFTQNTPFVGTVDGITPVNLLSNPFPGGLILPPGKSQGALTNVGQATPAVENYRPTPYIEQWMAGLQYELTRNDALDVSYVGNHGVKLLFQSVERDQLQPQQLLMGDALLNNVPNPFYGQISASGCGLNEPTVPAGQLLRPFPEFCSVSDSQPPAAFSSYNAFQITYNHRWSKGLQVVASFTASKYLDNAEGYEQWTAGNGYIRNNYNTSTEKSLNPDDIPKSFVLSYIYEIPVGRGKQYGSSLSKPLDAIVGGWQVSGITTFKSGFPLSITAPNNTNSLGGNQRPNLVGDPHVSNPTVNEWFNVNAFAQPPPFTFGNVGRYMPNLRAPGINNWDLAIQKWWSWQERLRIQFRAEMYNAFNHANFYAPDQNFADYGSTFGTITSANPAREFQMGLKLYF